ncbi:MAG: hypothetical protein ACRDSR_05625 [Pseudonocardiaceae bacterium]
MIAIVARRELDASNIPAAANVAGIEFITRTIAAPILTRPTVTAIA